MQLPQLERSFIGAVTLSTAGNGLSEAQDDLTLGQLEIGTTTLFNTRGGERRGGT